MIAPRSWTVVAYERVIALKRLASREVNEPPGDSPREPAWAAFAFVGDRGAACLRDSEHTEADTRPMI